MPLLVALLIGVEFCYKLTKIDEIMQQTYIHLIHEKPRAK